MLLVLMIQPTQEIHLLHRTAALGGGLGQSTEQSAGLPRKTTNRKQAHKQQNSTYTDQHNKSNQLK